MKPYFSIDLETTGDDPNDHQIIEIAAIYEDPNLQLPFEEIPKFQCFVKHDLYKGNAFALALNQRIFKALSNSAVGYNEHEAVVKLLGFFQKYKENDVVKITGKNVGSFDIQFLKKVKVYNEHKFLFNYRTLELGSFFFEPKTDEWIPNSDACLKRAGIDKSTKHEALSDAWDVICAIRTRY